MNCKVIAIENQKGGTGKSTTALNLGVGLKMKGKKVLIIPASVRVTEANMEGKSIFAYDGKCKVADAYKNLTKEVLDIAAREKARFRDDGSR